MTARRQFIQWIPAAGLAAMTARSAYAQGLPKLSDKDPAAAAQGYVEDATKADKAKHPRYAAGQHCGNCQLYSGKAGDASGPCILFQGKAVAAAGYCNAYNAKAG